MSNLNSIDQSIDLISANSHAEMHSIRKLGLAILVVGLLFFFMGLSNLGVNHPQLLLMV